FVSIMNRKAEQIGMKNTVFKTPHGLPAKGQFTTAADMLRLACRYLEAHPSARCYHSTPAILHNGILMQNTNKLLGHDAINGLKTGFTRASGYNIILTSTRHGMEMVGVLMRTPSVEVRTREAQRLLDYGASLRMPEKETMELNGGKKAKTAKTSREHPGRLARATASTRFANGEKTQTQDPGSGKKAKVFPPRRALPQTAALSPAAQGSQLR
ncbi:MAG: hypothetical protein FWG59_01095, partial [Betaproteobacteria bacterium]|nr:hypothetical protein [Betaproteobacteria bacterium]